MNDISLLGGALARKDPTARLCRLEAASRHAGAARSGSGRSGRICRLSAADRAAGFLSACRRPRLTTRPSSAYERLCEALNRARRAELIAMDAIRDGGGTASSRHFWHDADEFLEATDAAAENFRLDRQDGQPTRLAALVRSGWHGPAVSRSGRRLRLAGHLVGRLRERHREASLRARALTSYGEPVEVLHIGDHDPSGAHLFLALAEDVKAFAWRYDLDVTFTRLAVTPDQIEALALPTAPPKATDNRAFEGETCQAEAIPPDDARINRAGCHRRAARPRSLR